MGNQAMILLVGTLAIIALFVNTLMRTGGDQGRNALQAFAQANVREINNAAVELGLRTITDSTRYRTPFNNISLAGGTATITYKDTLVGSDSSVIVSVRSVYKMNPKDSAVTSSRVVVKPTGFVPHVVRGVFTAFGPLTDAVSDMFIDGRDWKYDLSGIIPTNGVYAVSTGAPTFANVSNGRLGGTTAPPGRIDIAPAFPHDSRIIETSSSWPNGWPTTPDAAFGYPEGKLKQMAINKEVPGSQYVTLWTQLKFPLKGITYIEVPNGTVWSKKHLGPSPEGVVVFHSPATNAYWNNISVPNDVPFKGLLVFDRIFHMHIDILGAVVLLSPNTTVGQNCNGNKDHFVRYSSETIMKYTGGGGDDASWKSKWKVVSWYD